MPAQFIYFFICFSKPCFKTYIFEETTDRVLVTSRTFAYIVEPLITKRQGAKEVFDITRIHYIEVIYYICNTGAKNAVSYFKVFAK